MFGGQLFVSKVSSAWKEEETGLVCFLGECGGEGAELIVKLRPKDFDRFHTLPLKKEKQGGSKTKAFDVYFVADGAVIKPQVTDEKINITLSDRSGNKSFNILFDLKSAKTLSQLLNQFIDLQARLVALNYTPI
jgi:hypothetical protein